MLFNIVMLNLLCIQGVCYSFEKALYCLWFEQKLQKLQLFGSIVTKEVILVIIYYKVNMDAALNESAKVVVFIKWYYVV